MQRVSGEIRVRADAAPLSEVLERIAGEIGMTLVYNGVAPPDERVTLDIVSATAPALVVEVLRDRGLNYALRTSADRTRVETLIVVGRERVEAAPAAAVARGEAPAHPILADGHPEIFELPDPPPDAAPPEPPVASTPLGKDAVLGPRTLAERRPRPQAAGAPSPTGR